MLVLSMQDDPRYVREAFAAGASGYVLKEAADAELVAAVREVAGGGSYVNPELGARLVAADVKARADAEADPLTDREREVLRLLALGHTNQEIAKLIYVSVRTAETHRAHIMQKLRLETRAELVRYALAHGLLDARDLELETRSRSQAYASCAMAGLPFEQRRPRAERRAEHRVVDELLDHPLDVGALEDEEDEARRRDARCAARAE